MRITKFAFYFILLSVVLSINSCFDDGSDVVDKKVQDSLKLDSINLEKIKHNENIPKITYSKVVIANNEHREKLMYEFRDSEENFLKNKIFCTLNRKERRFMRIGDTILVPDSITNSILDYSIFPGYYEGAKNVSKIIIVSNKYQSYACYEYGKLVRFAAANTGKEKTQTYPGRYALVWKQLVRKSSIDSTWILPFTFNFHKFAGSAFHQFTMPGYAASHSCIRQFKDDSKWLYYWGQVGTKDSNNQFRHLTGTPVLIIDVVDFTRRHSGPWKDLTSNKDFFLDLPDNPMEFEEALIPISQIPSSVRGILPNKSRYLYAEDTLRARGVIRADVTLTKSVDFNKLRRHKEAKKLKEAEEKAKHEQNESNSTD